MLEELTREDLIAAVDRAVDGLLTAAGVSAPPVDAVAIAQNHLGLTIRHGDRPRRRAAVPDGNNEIALSPGLDAEQTQMAVAKAIGAMLKPAILRDLGIPPEQQKGLTGASVSGLLAERLLLPSPWFAAAARASGFDVAELHRLFSTADMEAIALRLLDLPEPCVVAVVGNGVVIRRRSNAGSVNKKLTAAETECERQVRGDGQPHVVRADDWTAWGWRERGRQHVILRAVPD